MSDSPYTIHHIFGLAKRYNASDIYLSPDSYPILRVKDEFRPVRVKNKVTNEYSLPMTVKECNDLILSSMNPLQQKEFIETKDFDYAYYDDENPELGRFRVNVFVAMGSMELVARPIVGKPRDITTLFLPDVITELADKERTGLVVVTGATGSGKTSTLAGYIDRINGSRSNKIVTIEDPVEIIHTNKKSSVSQRELYQDTASFSVALRAAMRQRPDVILIGEMRDAETVSTAIGASESGHLVLSTLHSINAMDTIGRILDFYPQDEQQQIRNLLSSTLRAVISQRLIVDEEGQTRPLVEVLTQTLRIQDTIRDPEKTHNIRIIMEESKFDKMQTFEDHLTQMVSDDILSPQRALGYTENRQELERKFKQLALM